MRVSRIGLGVALTYAVLAVGSATWGYALTDPKESTVLMQLPVIPVLVVFGALGLVERLDGVPLPLFYGLSIPLTALALYAACWLWGALGPRTRLTLALAVLGALCALTLAPRRR